MPPFSSSSSSCSCYIYIFFKTILRFFFVFTTHKKKILDVLGQEANEGLSPECCNNWTYESGGGIVDLLSERPIWFLFPVYVILCLKTDFCISKIFKTVQSILYQHLLCA